MSSSKEKNAKQMGKERQLDGTAISLASAARKQLDFNKGNEPDFTSEGKDGEVSKDSVKEQKADKANLKAGRATSLQDAAKAALERQINSGAVPAMSSAVQKQHQNKSNAPDLITEGKNGGSTESSGEEGETFIAREIPTPKGEGLRKITIDTLGPLRPATGAVFCFNNDLTSYSAHCDMSNRNNERDTLRRKLRTEVTRKDGATRHFESLANALEATMAEWIFSENVNSPRVPRHKYEGNDIEHIPGVENIIADAMSRLCLDVEDDSSPHVESEEDDEEDIDLPRLISEVNQWISAVEEYSYTVEHVMVEVYLDDMIVYGATPREYF
jgi:hypothetical protein